MNSPIRHNLSYLIYREAPRGGCLVLLRCRVIKLHEDIVLEICRCET